MWCFRYALIATMLCSCIFLAACGGGSGRGKAMNGDPVAQSGVRSEELWYQYGGARLAYTAVARPKQLYTGYGGVLDPALSGQAPDTSREKTPLKRRFKPRSTAGGAGKTTAAPQRSPDCPPCPPLETPGGVPQSLTPQRGLTSPTTPYSPPAQTGSIPPPAMSPSPDPRSATASPRLTPLPAMPTATPAPASPKAPGS